MSKHLKVPKIDRIVEDMPESNKLLYMHNVQVIEEIKELQENIKLNEKQIQNLTRANIKLEDEVENALHEK